MNILKVEIKNMSKSFIIWTMILVGILSFFMSVFPSMSNSGMTEIIKAEMDALPEGMIQAFGVYMIDFTDLSDFFAYEYQYILIALCIYAGILGGNCLIKEESEGTIEFLYAQSISRNKIISSKLISIFFIILLLNIILFLVTIGFFEAFKPDNYEYFKELFIVFNGMFLLQITFLSIGILISTLVKKVSLATPIMLGIVFFSYILGMLSSIVEEIEWMKELSIIHYFMPNNVVNNGVEFKYIVICMLLTVFSLGFAYYRYNTKDFEI